MQDIVDFVKERSATCSSCIFTDANAGTWGPIPLVDGDAETVNVGACWGLVSGDASCGKAAQNEQDCTYEACTDCSDTASFEQCQQASLKGPCASEAAAFQKSCAAVITNAPSSCTDFYDSIRVQCVSGP